MLLQGTDGSEAWAPGAGPLTPLRDRSIRNAAAAGTRLHPKSGLCNRTSMFLLCYPSTITPLHPFVVRVVYLLLLSFVVYLSIVSRTDCRLAPLWI